MRVVLGLDTLDDDERRRSPPAEILLRRLRFSLMPQVDIVHVSGPTTTAGLPVPSNGTADFDPPSVFRTGS